MFYSLSGHPTHPVGQARLIAKRLMLKLCTIGLKCGGIRLRPISHRALQLKLLSPDTYPGFFVLLGVWE
jgi:hypothetical protein